MDTSSPSSSLLSDLPWIEVDQKWNYRFVDAGAEPGASLQPVASFEDFKACLEDFDLLVRIPACYVVHVIALPALPDHHADLLILLNRCCGLRDALKLRAQAIITFPGKHAGIKSALIIFPDEVAAGCAIRLCQDRPWKDETGFIQLKRVDHNLLRRKDIVPALGRLGFCIFEDAESNGSRKHLTCKECVLQKEVLDMKVIARLSSHNLLREVGPSLTLSTSDVSTSTEASASLLDGTEVENGGM